MLLKIQFSYGMFAALCNYLPNGGLLIKITSYLNKGNTASIFSAISLERLCVFFMVVHFYKKLTKTKQGTVFVNLYLLYFISAFLFWDFGVVVQRFTLLFACSEWILVPELLYAFKRKDERILVMLLFMAYVAFKIYKDVVHSPWLSYTTCFNEVDYTVKAKTLRNLGF